MQVDITPSTDLIQSWRQQLPRWSTIFGELIDNAFDADATQINITLESNSLTFQDNGTGCNDLRLMLTAGKHIKHRSTRLGRYGIGFKQATASAGDRLTVTSIADGILRASSVNWNFLAKSGEWKITLEKPVTIDQPSGTIITITGLRNKDGLGLKQVTTLLDHLREQYTPAIKQGRQLLVHNRSKTTRLQAVPLPELISMRNIDLDVEGKKARLLLGLVPDGVSYKRSGLTVSYGFRVIEHGVRWGLGDKPTPGLVGWLDLLEGWNLSTNKEHVLDEHLDQLKKQINERCAEVIALAVKRGFNIPLHEVNSRINQMLQSIIGLEIPSKESRHAAAARLGSIQPRHTGRRRLHGRKTQPGQAFLQDVRSHGFQISLGKLGDDAPLYNYQQCGIVELNLDNPLIAAHQGDVSYLAAQAVHALASYTVLEAPNQRSFSWLKGKNAYEDIASLVGHMMRHLPTVQDDTL